MFSVREDYFHLRSILRRYRGHELLWNVFVDIAGENDEGLENEVNL